MFHINSQREALTMVQPHTSSSASYLINKELANSLLTESKELTTYFLSHALSHFQSTHAYTQFDMHSKHGQLLLAILYSVPTWSTLVKDPNCSDFMGFQVLSQWPIQYALGHQTVPDFSQVRVVRQVWKGICSFWLCDSGRKQLGESDSNQSATNRKE
jgi:hypothetical protein